MNNETPEGEERDEVGEGRYMHRGKPASRASRLVEILQDTGSFIWEVNIR